MNLTALAVITTKGPWRMSCNYVPPPPRPNNPVLAVCCLLAISAHFTHSSTPLTLICVSQDNLHVSRAAFATYTDGLHGPMREDYGVPGL